MTPMYLSHTTWCLEGRETGKVKALFVTKEKEGTLSLTTNAHCEIRANEAIFV